LRDCETFIVVATDMFHLGFLLVSGPLDIVETAEAACWRLVECGVVPLGSSRSQAGAPGFHLVNGRRS
jgi:hypothetical protein